MHRIQNSNTHTHHHYPHNEPAQENSAGHSKCSTPKRNKHRSYQDRSAQSEQEDGSNEKTEHKTNKLFASRKTAGTGFQQIMEGKLSNYEIIAGTLREYVKQQEEKCASRRKYLATVTQIIKAYARSEISDISPSVSLLISKILDSLPHRQGHRKSIPRRRQREKEKQRQKQKQKQKQRESLGTKARNRNSKHSRQFSFSHKKEKTLQSEIEELEYNLRDLRKQSRILEQIKEQYEEMEYNDKLEYIGELEEIVRKQKEIIDNIHQY